MSSIAYGKSSCVRNAPRLLAVALAAATLAACAQSAMVPDKSASIAAARRASSEPARSASLYHHRRATVAKKLASSAIDKPAAGKQEASHGLASYYSYDPKTASGEKFDPNELTAAHRTLPFGTRLRVTNVATGRSVTVRVNDRGPFVPGRVVDVSRSAAESLGMTKQGLAKVKLDVVQ